MSIQQKHGSWYVVLYYRDQTDKAKYKWYLSGPVSEDKNGKKAKQYERQLLVDIERGVLKITEKTTLNTFIDKWIELEIEPTLAPRTTYNYRKKMNCLVNNIGDISLDKITPIKIKGHINTELRRGLKPSSIHAQMTVIKLALRKAVQWGLLTSNPCDYMDLPKVDEPNNAIYTPEQVDTAIMCMNGTYLYLPCILGFFCGLRRGEICGLRWQDVDLENKKAAIVHSYNRNPLTGKLELQKVKTPASKAKISLPDIAVAALTSEKEQQNKDRQLAGKAYQDEDHVWAWPTGEPRQPDQLYLDFTNMLITNNLPVIRPHDMRHTFATLLYEAGLDDKSVSAAVRHARASFTTDYYVHMREKTKSQAAEAINRRYPKPLDKH
ncbi:MAG: phage integrase family protein [Firmicutes bacterium]|nr:phage integrase family protein [Bacillota bacterium]